MAAATTTGKLELVIGNRTYSSWSLRGYLLLAEAQGLEFSTKRIPLFTKAWDTTIGAHSPARRVPVLHDGALTVWDTAAMAEHLIERFGERAVGYPHDAAARALARSISMEMHSGFLAIREELPFNVRRANEPPAQPLSATCEAQVRRTQAIWAECYDKFGGPFLFGAKFGVADAMYAPVALRFVTYGIPVDAAAQKFVDAVCGLESVKEWKAAALEEDEHIDFIDTTAPIENEPITLG